MNYAHIKMHTRTQLDQNDQSNLHPRNEPSLTFNQFTTVILCTCVGFKVKFESIENGFFSVICAYAAEFEQNYGSLHMIQWLIFYICYYL